MLKIGIVGATGAVGREFLTLMEKRSFPMEGLRLFASARSAGKQLSHGSRTWTVEETRPEIFKELDIAIFSAGGSLSRDLGPVAAESGCTVIDNSSAFRMTPEVPLVIPEINPEAAQSHRGIIANPNCSTAIALMGLYPLHKAFGLTRFIAATYQAVSGTGAAAIDELENQVRDHIEDRQPQPSIYSYPIAFNLIPHVDQFLEDGSTREEMKMLNESRKILGHPSLKVSTTCVRVPVIRAHSIAINAEFSQPVSLCKAREAIQAFPGAILVDDPKNNQYPMPLDFSEKEACGVGRLRIDTALDNALSLWVSGDQLWKGAALNALQIAELLMEKGWIRPS